MESRASVARKIKVRNLPKINLDIYSMIALNNLVVYAVHYLQEREVTATVEEIVSICFRLFPQSFALKNYPRWPDSALVIRRLNDGREKGNLKGNSMDGFLVKYKGKQLAKRVAKVLGLIQPAPAKIKKRPSPAKRKATLVDPAKIRAKRAKIISHKQKVIVPAAMKKTAKKHATVPVKKTSIKQKLPKPGPAKIAQSKQMTMGFLIPQEKKAKRGLPPPTSHISKEEKAKAGKFVHLMERSDAYVYYKKNGKNSKIGEFDFRSLLLCTMESSRETLVKNINLFKGYAGIHNRQDLITFLSHCEDKFSYLLVTPQKKAKKLLRKQGDRERNFNG